MCHKDTILFRGAALAAIGCSVVWGQTASETAAPHWRRIGNQAVDTTLAAPATGPVDAVWFAADGSRLYARTRTGGTFETADFENWTTANSPAAPLPDNPANAIRPPAPECQAGGFPHSRQGVRAGAARIPLR